MGIYYCCRCGYQMCGEWFCCEACKLGEGGGSILCQECANEGCCDQCYNKCCVYCVKDSKKMFSCCGMILCGAATDEGRKNSSTCISKHVMKTFPCGHKTCNFPLDEEEEEEESGEDEEGNSNKDKDVEESGKGADVEESGKGAEGENEKEEETCYKCLRAKFVEAEEMAREQATKEDVAVIESIMVQIKSSKIKSMLQDIVDDPKGQKRERDNERFAELQFSLRKANNAYVACRCDARYLYY